MAARMKPRARRWEKVVGPQVETARDAVVAPDHSKFDVAAPVARGIDACGDRASDAWQIIGVNARLEYGHFHLGVRREGPHCADPLVPFERAGDRVP